MAIKLFCIVMFMSVRCRVKAESFIGLDLFSSFFTVACYTVNKFRQKHVELRFNFALCFCLFLHIVCFMQTGSRASRGVQ